MSDLATPAVRVRRGRRTDTGVVAGLVVLTLALAVPYAVAGPNFVLDDWFMLRNAHFDGVWAGAGRTQSLARPGQWVVYVVEFGMIGRHPLAIYLVQVVVRAAVVVALFLLFRRYLSRLAAAGVAAAWALFPNATSMEFWATGLNIAVSLLLLVLGALLLTRGAEVDRPSWGAVACLVGSVLAYEATLPTAAALVLAVPVAKRRLRWREVLVGLAALGASGLWVLANWNPAKPVLEGFADLSTLFPAHFGWGVFPDGPAARAGGLVVAAGLTVLFGRLLLPGFRGGAGRAEALALAGLAVIVAGTLPWVRYFYAPLGAGDRVNVVSSVGAAMVWAALGVALARWPPLAITAAVAVAAVTIAVRVERADTWAAAGEHVLELLPAVQQAIPEPTGTIVVGPEPWQRDNVAGVLDASNIDSALQLQYADPNIRASMAFSEAWFLTVPRERRFDLRGLRTYPP